MHERRHDRTTTAPKKNFTAATFYLWRNRSKEDTLSESVSENLCGSQSRVWVCDLSDRRKMTRETYGLCVILVVIANITNDTVDGMEVDDLNKDFKHI